MKTSLALKAVPRDNLERMTLNLRRRARNEKLAWDRLLGRLVGTASSMTGAALMGHMIGTRLRDKKPTTLGKGGDIELWYGGVSVLIGAFIQAKAKKAPFRIFGEAVEGSGQGALAYWAGSKAEAAAMKAKPQIAVAA